LALFGADFPIKHHYEETRYRSKEIKSSIKRNNKTRKSDQTMEKKTHLTGAMTNPIK